MVELEVLDVIQAEEQQYPIVLLRHENRILTMVIGIPEATAIQIGLLREKTPRPMTHDLVCNILAGLDAEIKSVTIYSLENDTFFAHLHIEKKNDQGEVEQVLRIDSRPSDGIAIAVRTGCPIYASEDVMAKASHEATIPDDDEEDDGEAFSEE